jgi:hypothetical protein
MARLSNDRQERFAQLVAVSVPDVVAYREAGLGGGAFDAKNASKLKHKPKVKARIAELCATTESMVEIRRTMLDEFYVACMKIDRVDLLRRIGAGDGDDDLTPVERSLIEGREETKYGIKYVMPKKLEAAEKLARLHGLDKPLKIAETTADGKELPSTADRARALAAFIAETQAEMAAMDAKENAG